MPYIDIAAIIVCATIFYRIGDEEYGRGVLIGGVSALLWIGTSCYLSWGVLACLVVQGGLFGLLTMMNTRNNQRSPRS